MDPNRWSAGNRTLETEHSKIAELLASAHQEGHSWGDMAVLCRKQAQMEDIARTLKQRKLPHKVRKSSGDYDALSDAIKVMTMHASKGLEWPVVALAGVGRMPAEGEDEKDEARLFYVAATRATERLYITTGAAQARFA
jgi:superfamily I DNA/RNA helicase